MSFKKFGTAVRKRFDEMSREPLFRVGVDEDQLWEHYLSSFPPGSNPVYRKRTEHDCSCCRSFVKNIGSVVSIRDDGTLSTVWDCEPDDPAYLTVAKRMSEYVRGRVIRDEFLHPERKVGIETNYSQGEDGEVLTFDHFHVEIPFARNTGPNFYCQGKEIPTRLGESRSTHDVLLRSLTEITLESVDTVLELISQNSLYRGEEHKFAVSEFRKLKNEFERLSPEKRDNLVWSRMKSVPGSVSRIRNTSIGTLLVDLSEDADIEDAVRKFEKMVAPANYKRPTSLVTKSMVEDARRKLQELGLVSSLERRFARLSDVGVQNALFVDRMSRKVLTGDVFDQVPTKKTLRKLDKVEEIGIEKFLSDVVPNIQSLEILFENRHVGNLVSLIAPEDRDALPLFKWGNPFSWSYNGDAADSIRERVKKAGGNVTGDLCCRLAWFNYDDLDLHMHDPGHHIYYGNRTFASPSGGILDVDMNAGGGRTREPVENIFYPSRSKMREGEYVLSVHQYAKRETENSGFEVEIDWMGDVHRFAYDKPLRTGQEIRVARMWYTMEKGIEFLDALPSSTTSKKVWNLATHDFHKVNLLMLSPNYWDGRGVGNKHYFFMLEGCLCDGETRGFFNEFLRDDLSRHRKVFEIVGSRTRPRPSDDQLSGLGFSSTKRDEIVARVKGNFTRDLRVVF
jgi:hypothetical protein